VSAAAIETRGLGRRFGRVLALEDLTLRVDEGEVFGFLGPNGAGKTTTIRCLLGLITPTSGTASILGRPAGEASVRADVGYLPGDLMLWPWYTGAQTLDFLARLSGRAPGRRAALLDLFGFSAADLGRKVGAYSDGMKQKIGVIQAMQCEPRLILLDEPTKGLDPLVQQAFYHSLTEARAGGATIFFSSHILPEVERVCDRVAMLRRGKLVSVGSVDEARRAQLRRVVVRFSREVAPGELSPFGRIVEHDALRVSMLVTQADLPALITRLAGLPIADLEADAPHLEDAFLEYYK
jgi:ABC-2 type transport system ATP-binding protein